MNLFRKNSTRELLAIFMGFVVLMLVSSITGLDLFIAKLFYNNESKWFYRNQFVFENIFHKGGIWLTVAIFLWLFYKVLNAAFNKNNTKDFDYYFLVFVSSFLSIALIAFLKNHTTLPCPWDLQVFGGARLDVSVFSLFSLGLPSGHCFPAGHASGGYCFLSLYFIHFRLFRVRDYKKLSFGLFFGVLFGLTQQMRGAHFLSHDLATIAVSIIIPLITTHIYFYYNKAL